MARLQQVAAAWPSADRLAKATGVSASAFRKWLKGEAEPSRDRLVALAAAAGVNLSWLAQGEGPEPDLADIGGRVNRTGPANPAGLGRFLILPPTPAAPSPASGRTGRGGATEFIGFRHDWIRAVFGREPDDIMLATATGDTMAPHIHHGDHLLVDTTDTAIGWVGVYLIQVGEHRLVKRVQRRFDGSLLLINDNERYQSEVVEPAMAEELRVLGRVIWRGGLA